MMRMKIANSVLVVLLGLGVSTAFAGPERGKSKGGCNKPCGAKSAVTVADKPVDDGRSDADLKAKKGGCNKPCGKSAITVADKPAETKTRKGGCSKPCNKPCGKSAITASDKPAEAKTGKGGSAVTTGHKGCPKGCTKDCCKKKGAALTGDKSHPCPLTGKPITKGDCPIEKKANAVLASMPTMKYRVGDQTTCCSKSANAIAKKSGKPVEYVVGDNTFGKKGDAVAKLTSLLENEVESLHTVQHTVNGKPYGCGGSASTASKKSGKKLMYRVGAVDFKSEEDAEHALSAIDHALAEVKISYKVGDTSYCCSQTAAAMAKKNKKELTYVVGDVETTCEKTAKMNLADAKVKAIVEAAVVTSLSL